MSSRIDLTLRPCAMAGYLAAAPWLVASVFILAAATSGKTWMLVLIPITLAGAIFQYRLNGLLAGPSAVLGLQQHQNTLYAQLGNGQSLAVTASPSSRISSTVALLKLHSVTTKSRSYPVILITGARVAGNVSEDSFRRLRMWLRLGRAQPSFE